MHRHGFILYRRQRARVVEAHRPLLLDSQSINDLVTLKWSYSNVCLSYASCSLPLTLQHHKFKNLRQFHDVKKRPLTRLQKSFISEGCVLRQFAVPLPYCVYYSICVTRERARHYAYLTSPHLGNPNLQVLSPIL